MNLDLYFFNLINQFATKWLLLDKMAIFFAEYFQYALIVIFSLFLLKNYKRYLPMLFSAAASVFLSRIVITEIIRFFFFRPRPFVIEKVNLILTHDANASFPSGHAAFFFALATAVYFCNKKWGILFFVFAFLISISRVFGGIHWPADILAGAAVGIFSGWLIRKIFQKFFKQKTPQ